MVMRVKAFRVIAVVGMVTAGCTQQGSLVATRTLLNVRGGLDEGAYTAALQAKFPPGSLLATLREYVVSVNGHCDEKAPGEFVCEVPEGPPACYYNLMEIDARSDGTNISSLQVAEVIVRC
jgi:hypothetical protein